MFCVPDKVLSPALEGAQAGVLGPNARTALTGDRKTSSLFVIMSHTESGLMLSSKTQIVRDEWGQIF